MSSIQLIYCPCPSTEEAEHIGSLLVHQRLVACANVMAPMQSHYFWQGTQEKAAEIPLLCKTSQTCLPAALEAIQQAHSYEIPCILHWETQCNAAYFAWVEKATKSVASEPNIQ